MLNAMKGYEKSKGFRLQFLHLNEFKIGTQNMADKISGGTFFKV
jgi:hypothetical protein